MTSYTLTPEQQLAVELFATGDNLVIQAGAGTGKTSTLVAIAEKAAELGKRGQYLAFNKAVTMDAAERMPSSVRASTVHSLAFQAIGRRYAHRLKAPRMHSTEVAAILGIDPLTITVGTEQRALRPAFLAGQVMAGIARFCNSDDPEPSGKHIPFITGIDLVADEHGNRLEAVNNRAVKKWLEPALARAWTDLSQTHGRLRFSHDCYLKIFELGDPRILADFVMLDEGQDASPVMLSILRKQRSDVQIIVVGDSQQQLYAWRGAVDALQAAVDERARECFLQTSFRFGQGIADHANTILSLIEGAELRLTGAGPESSVGPTANPNAVLCRTNAGAITVVLNAMLAGARVHLVGGGGEIKGFCEGARDLMNGRHTQHPELACFDTWGEVQQYVMSDPQGGELRLMVRLIEQYGVESILRAVENTIPEPLADLIVSTAHKSKGREWDSVQLYSDFPDTALESIEELRLLYVAVTRAKRHLDYSRCGVLVELFDDDDDDLPAPIIAEDRADFDGCDTVEAVDAEYKRLFAERDCATDADAYWDLSERARLAYTRLSKTAASTITTVDED